MKFLTCADLHFQKEAPLYRKDDYFETQLRKFRWIVGLANEHNAQLLIAGDIFDSAKAGYVVTNNLLLELSRLNKTAISCFGNHDTHFHSSDLGRTPFGTLLAAGQVSCSCTEIGDVRVSILNWEGIPTPPVKGKVNILLGHISVFEGALPFWAEKDSSYTASSLVKKYPGYDWYVTGDIHLPFQKGKVINPGSMCRMNQGQMDFAPRVYLFDTETAHVQKFYIPIEESSAVFDVTAADLAKAKDNKALNAFVGALKGEDSSEAPNFRSTLDSVIKEALPPKEVITIISTIIGG